jgi:hypothetical protein
MTQGEGKLSPPRNARDLPSALRQAKATPTSSEWLTCISVMAPAFLRIGAPCVFQQQGMGFHATAYSAMLFV